MEWLANIIGGSIFKAFGDVIVQPILSAYLKSKDVDLEKFKQANTSLEHAAVAVLEANTRFAAAQVPYVMSVLQWWPFRVILFCLLAVPALHFCAFVLDHTVPYMIGCGDSCTWKVPEVTGGYAVYEKELLEFFIVAKPVDTAVSGALGVLQRWLAK
jgi:hypothetical protein